MNGVLLHNFIVKFIIKRQLIYCSRHLLLCRMRLTLGNSNLMIISTFAVMTWICTGLNPEESKIDFALCVIPGYQRSQVYQRVDLEVNIVVTRCRFAHHLLRMCTPKDKNIYISAPLKREKAKSHVCSHEEVSTFRENSQSNTHPHADINSIILRMGTLVSILSL